jgi:general secretion pathway protein L
MQWWQPWRLTVVLLLFFGVLQLADLVIFYQQLQQQTQQLNQQIEQIYRQTFPTAQKIVNPRVQMEQQLKELTAKTTHSPSANFLVMLNQLSPILTKATELTVKEIHFQNNKLELNLEATDVTTLEGLKRLLKAANVDATVITLSNDIKAVKAKLQMGGISTN